MNDRASGLGLAGKVAIVTGAGRPNGVGRATALRLAREGARTVLVDLATGTPASRTDIDGISPDLDRVVDEVRQTGAEAIGVTADVSVEVEVDAVMTAAAEAFGRIDVVVCNAAILSDRRIDPLSLPTETFSRVLAVNLTGTFLCARAGARQMASQGDGGAIITVGSRASRRGNASLVAYSASKFGVIGLTQSLASAFAAHHIRVNCVCPGSVDTDMVAGDFQALAEASGMTVKEARMAAASDVLTGRLTTPDDIASAIAWFASPESGQITGQALNVNGGTWMS